MKAPAVDRPVPKEPDAPRKLVPAPPQAAQARAPPSSVAVEPERPETPAVVATAKPAADAALSQQAEQLVRGEAALARGDYAIAYESFRPLAERGNTRAQTRLAEMYAGGQGVKRNPNQAYIWYSLAAQGGNASAAAERAKIAALLQPAEIKQADRVVENMRKR